MRLDDLGLAILDLRAPLRFRYPCYAQNVCPPMSELYSGYTWQAASYLSNLKATIYTLHVPPYFFNITKIDHDFDDPLFI
jgi:hypothetical protein